MKSALLPSLFLTLLTLPARAGSDLAVVAELPSAGTLSTLVARRLGRDETVSLVGFTADSIQTWRLGSVAEPVLSPGGIEPTVADVDGDGLLDVVVLRKDPPAVVVLRGDGGGRFAEAATIPLGATPYGLTAGDVDGDGRPDLLVSTYRPEGVALEPFRNKGLLAFEALPSTRLSASLITAGDLDGDGRADLVVTPPMGFVQLLRGMGDGTFVKEVQATGYYPRRPILVDVDGDGRLDVVYRNDSRYLSVAIVVLRNDGGFRFTTPTGPPTLPLTESAGDVAVADVNGDGTLDLAVENSPASGVAPATIEVFPGDGHGGFGAATFRPLPASVYTRARRVLLPLDWDADGQGDFVLTSDHGAIVYSTGDRPRLDLATVPILVSTTGLLGSRFDSDLLLTNAGTTPVRVALHYVASLGGGTGVVTREIAAGAQLAAPSAHDFLRNAGLAIQREGPLAGVLQVSTTGASTPGALSASVRTTSPSGAGVSCASVPRLSLLRTSAVVPWLLETERDRSNLALVNAGAEEDGAVTLRVTVEPGDRGEPAAVLPDVVLLPGGFAQIGRVLRAAGLASAVGWARITRVAGSAPYLAWGVVNDAGSGDGSFVPAVRESDLPASRWVVPSVVQSGRYGTELVVTNPADVPLAVRITLAATGSAFDETLAPRAILHLPDFFAELRRRGVPGAPAAEVDLASPLTVDAKFLAPVLVGARVTTTSMPERRYGLFEPAVDAGASAARSVVIPDLRQDATTRTNLGIVDLTNAAPVRIEIFDGATGRLAASRDLPALAPNELRQLNAVLRELAPAVARGWARLVPAGGGALAAFAVILDGAEPGLGTDDGSFVPGVPE